MKKIIFIIFILLSILLNANNIEGINSNFHNIKRFYCYENTEFQFNISEYIYSYDNFTYRLLNQVILENKNNENIDDSLINDFYKGLYLRITKSETHNYFEDYIKLYAFIMLNDTMNSKLMMNKLKQYNKKEIDSILMIVKSANLVRQKKYKEAYQLIKNYKDDFSLYIRSIFYIENNDKEKALIILKKISNKRLLEDTYILIAEILLEKKSYNQALSYIDNFEKYFMQSKNYYTNLYLKGLVYYHKGYFNKSIKILREVTLKSRNSKIKGNAYYLIGKNYFMLGKYDEMEKYLSYVKNPLIKSDYKKNALFLDGKGMFFKGEYNKAINKFLEFLNEYPNDFLTPYAYQLLAESYFNVNDYDKVIYYMNKVDKPNFLKKKLIYLKYFIDYKNGVYSDSINAYIDFLRKEKDNPLRNEIYDYIFSNSNNDSLKNELLKQYINEFPDNKKNVNYVIELIPFLIFEELTDDIYFYSNKVKKYFPKQKDIVFTSFINKMIEMGMYKQTIEYYTRYAEFFEKENSQIMYKIAKILLNENNEKGCEILLKNIIEKFQDEYSDSSYIYLSKIYLKDNNIKQMELLYRNYRKLQKNMFIEALLLYNIGLYYKNNAYYDKAMEVLLESAEDFGEYRNEAAQSLLEASECAYKNNDKEYASILLEKAELLATEIDILNTIKIKKDKYNE